MSSIPQVSELNNTGAALLAQGGEKEAVKTLRKALIIVERRMSDLVESSRETSYSGSASSVSPRNNPSDRSSSRGNSSNTNTLDETPSEIGGAKNTPSTPPSSFLHKTSRQAPTTTVKRGGSIDSFSSKLLVPTNINYQIHAKLRLDEPKNMTEIPELRDDQYVIFNQALMLVVPVEESLPGCDSQCPTELVIFYTIVIIYNIALMYHKQHVVSAKAQRSPLVENISTSSFGAISNCSSGGGASNQHLSRSPSAASICSAMRSSSDSSFGLGLTPSPKLTAAAIGRIAVNPSTFAFSQSLRLYEHCLRLVQSIVDYSEDCKVLLYAISCNLAHLYCRKGDRSRAQALLDDLPSVSRLS